MHTLVLRDTAKSSYCTRVAREARIEADRQQFINPIVKHAPVEKDDIFLKVYSRDDG
jgi:hypothetical protein